VVQSVFGCTNAHSHVIKPQVMCVCDCLIEQTAVTSLKPPQTVHLNLISVQIHYRPCELFLVSATEYLWHFISQLRVYISQFLHYNLQFWLHFSESCDINSKLRLITHKLWNI